MLPSVTLFTDGACHGNPGPGGWAYILRHDSTGRSKSHSGSEPATTNNRMELQAVIHGLEALKRRCRVKLVTDSEYVAKGINQWLPKWKARGWSRSATQHKPPENLDLWQKIDDLLAQHEVHAQHVYGHAGHPENEQCDRLAVAAYQHLLNS